MIHGFALQVGRLSASSCGGAGVLAELDSVGVATVQDAIVQAVQAQPAAEDEEAPVGVCLALHHTAQSAVVWNVQAQASVTLSL